MQFTSSWPSAALSLGEISIKFNAFLEIALGTALMVSGPSSAMAEKLVISNWDGYMP